MSEVLEFKTSEPQIGYLSRKSVKGPEHRLAMSFLEHMPKRRSGSIAVFLEPLMDTGYPDIVIVYYKHRVFDEWVECRKNLTLTDIKILHYLYLSGGATSDVIEGSLGVSGKNLLNSIERLLDSRMIRRYAKQWSPYILKRRYAVERIVAIEAKIKDWQSAFSQAALNRWFASESFIVSPVRKPTQKILMKSNELGVGIYSHNKSKTQCITGAKQHGSPSCYASWLFNEWIGRRLCKE